jgi:hypothetical protein
MRLNIQYEEETNFNYQATILESVMKNMKAIEVYKTTKFEKCMWVIPHQINTEKRHFQPDPLRIEQFFVRV